jgi:capsular polysaccharide transport system permease protein
MQGVRSATSVTLAVWRALFLREALTRLSAGRFAWVWLFLEPVAQVALLMVVFTIVRGKSLPFFDFAVFLAIGVLGFGMFSNVALRSMEAISANMALFAYRQVKPVDAVLIRAILEGVLQLLVSVILLSGAAFIGLRITRIDVMQILTVVLAMWGFGAGFALLLSVPARLVPEVAKIVRMLFAPLHLISGIFFSPFMVPAELRQWLLLNPIMQGIELLRTAFLAGYPLVPDADIGYLSTFAVSSIFFGLALQIRFARRLIQK